MAAHPAVIDTNVFVGALLSRGGRNREVLRACFEDRLQPVMGHTLFLEYEEVLGREALFAKSPLSAPERQQLFEDFSSICKWARVYYLWRPNLPDAGDNHVLELAVAGAARSIVTNNVADFRASEPRFPQIRVLSPEDVLEEVA